MCLFPTLQFAGVSRAAEMENVAAPPPHDAVVNTEREKVAIDHSLELAEVGMEAARAHLQVSPRCHSNVLITD